MKILKKLSDVYKIWHNFLPRLPRLTRYTIGTKIDILFIDIIELCLSGSYMRKEEKIETIQKMSNKLNSLKFFLKLLWEMKLINDKKYLYISSPLVEIGKMVGGWLKMWHKVHKRRAF